MRWRSDSSSSSSVWSFIAKGRGFNGSRREPGTRAHSHAMQSHSELPQQWNWSWVG